MQCQRVNRTWTHCAQTERLWIALPLLIQQYGPQPLTTRQQHLDTLALTRAIRQAQLAAGPVWSRWPRAIFQSIFFSSSSGSFAIGDVLFPGIVEDLSIDQVAPTFLTNIQQWQFTRLVQIQLVAAVWNVSFRAIVYWWEWPWYWWLGLQVIFSWVFVPCRKIDTIRALMDSLPIDEYELGHFVRQKLEVPPDQIYCLHLSWLRALDAAQEKTRWNHIQSIWCLLRIWTREMLHSIDLQLLCGLPLLLTTIAEMCIPIMDLAHDKPPTRILLSWLGNHAFATPRDKFIIPGRTFDALWGILAPQCLVPALILTLGSYSPLSYILCLFWWTFIAYERYTASSRRIT
jgi:hypothetical protein